MGCSSPSSSPSSTSSNPLAIANRERQQEAAKRAANVAAAALAVGRVVVPIEPYPLSSNKDKWYSSSATTIGKQLHDAVGRNDKAKLEQLCREWAGNYAAIDWIYAKNKGHHIHTHKHKYPQ